MSDPIPSNTDIDAEEISWEVLTNQSSSTSIENLSVEVCNHLHETLTQNNEYQLVVPEDNETFVKEDNITRKKTFISEKTSSLKKFLQPYWSKVRSRFWKTIQIPSYFTTFSLVAFIIIATSLIVLWPILSATTYAPLEIFPNEQYTEYNNNDMVKAFIGPSEILTEPINISEIIGNKDEIVPHDNVCHLEDVFQIDSDVKFITQNADVPIHINNIDEYFSKSMKNHTGNFLKFLKETCLVPSMYLLLCSIFKDLLLVMILQHLERKLQILPATNNSLDLDTTIKTEKLTKSEAEEDKLNAFFTDHEPDIKLSLPTLSNNSTKVVKDPKFTPTNNINVINHNEKVENGKSECERRFEDLDSNWQSIGKMHRQKIRELKEDFESKVLLMKIREKVPSIRKQKIQILRDRYNEKLRRDRDKYLLKLQKIREERQKNLNEICGKNQGDNKKYKTTQKHAKNFSQSSILPLNLSDAIDPYVTANFQESSNPIKNNNVLKNVSTGLEKHVVSQEGVEHYDCYKKEMLNDSKDTVTYKDAAFTLGNASMPNEFYKFGFASNNRDISNQLDIFKNELKNPESTLHNKSLVHSKKDILLKSNKTTDKITKSDKSLFRFLESRSESQEYVTVKSLNDSNKLQTDVNAKSNTQITLFRPQYSKIFGTERKNDTTGTTSSLLVNTEDSSLVTSIQNSQGQIQKAHKNKDVALTRSENTISLPPHSLKILKNKVDQFAIKNNKIFKYSPTDKKLKEKSRTKSIPVKKIKSEENEDLQNQFEGKLLKQSQIKLEKDTVKGTTSHTLHESSAPESETESEVENEIRQLIKDVPSKKDLYRILFGKKGMMIKKKEESMLEKEFSKLFTLPVLLSKNNPKLHKRVKVFKRKL